jgi:hypothetical protein
VQLLESTQFRESRSDCSYRNFNPVQKRHKSTRGFMGPTVEPLRMIKACEAPFSPRPQSTCPSNESSSSGPAPKMFWTVRRLLRATRSCASRLHIRPRPGLLGRIFGSGATEHEPAGHDRDKCLRFQGLGEVPKASEGKSMCCSICDYHRASVRQSRNVSRWP